MKIRLLSLLVMLLLLCSGCGRDRALSGLEVPTEPASTAAVTEAPAEVPAETVTEASAAASRSPHVTLIQTYEGEPYPVEASLYETDDFSMYIPDGDWLLTGEDFWTYAYNDEITMSVIDYQGISDYREVAAVLQDNGFELQESEGPFGTPEGFLPEDSHYLITSYDGIRREIFLLQEGQRIRGFSYAFPDSTEFMEGLYSSMPMILNTFLWK